MVYHQSSNLQGMVDPKKLREFLSKTHPLVRAQGTLSQIASDRLSRLAEASGTTKSCSQLAIQIIEDYVRSDSFLEELEAEETEYLLKSVKKEV